MVMTFVMIFAILAALTFGFAIGRIWQIRRDELARRHGFALPPMARIPLPKDGAGSIVTPTQR